MGGFAGALPLVTPTGVMTPPEVPLHRGTEHTQLLLPSAHSPCRQLTLRPGQVLNGVGGRLYPSGMAGGNLIYGCSVRSLGCRPAPPLPRPAPIVRLLHLQLFRLRRPGQPFPCCPGKAPRGRTRQAWTSAPLPLLMLFHPLKNPSLYPVSTYTCP